ncbi:hypothetical protein ACFRAR_00340 [Kitasatospora sp. NPDC056651]|uniref:hypothetical protein n=1 Tax=Kitasatospora sp. NPDC056651 TaxID=3345892 RepID=UPI0036B7D0F1
MIKQAELVGDWSNSAGAKVHVADDHGLTASGIGHAVPDYKCATSLTAGKWQFWVQDGSPNSLTESDTATEGKRFGVTVNTSGTQCDLAAKVQRDDRGFNLCLVRDLDQTCTGEELLRKDAANTR